MPPVHLLWFASRPTATLPQVRHWCGCQALENPPVERWVSFAGYFLALHVIEAIWLRRLFASALPASR